MSKQIPPCYDTKARRDCSRRKAGCHQHCKKWKEYEERRNADYISDFAEKECYSYQREKRERAYLKKVQRGLKYKGGDD